MIYRVVIPLHVLDQIDEHMVRIAQDSVDRALNWQDGLMDHIARLDELPKAHPISEADTEINGYELRKLNHGNYLVIFRVDEDRHMVFVEGFRHGAMLPKALE